MSDESNTLTLFQKLIHFQNERVHVFRLFEEGYKMYMASAPNYDFVKFCNLVSDVTKDFKRISTGIIAIEGQLRFEGHNAIADLVQLLQEEEETRLQICVKLQIAKQDAIENPNIPDKWKNVAALKEMYNRSIQLVENRVEDLRFEVEGQ